MEWNEIQQWLHYVFGPLLFLTSAFLIVVVLLQRGKGGGLVGALGGAGGQSAFGTKFGDRLMWVTYGVAVFWMVLILLSILLLSKTSDPVLEDGDDADPVVTVDPKVESEADKEDEKAKEAAAKEDTKDAAPESEGKPNAEPDTQAKPDNGAAPAASETKTETETKPETEPQPKPEENPPAKPEEEAPKPEEKPADPTPPTAGDAPK